MCSKKYYMGYGNHHGTKGQGVQESISCVIWKLGIYAVTKLLFM
jgi:hypothetical protein